VSLTFRCFGHSGCLWVVRRGLPTEVSSEDRSPLTRAAYLPSTAPGGSK